MFDWEVFMQSHTGLQPSEIAQQLDLLEQTVTNLAQFKMNFPREALVGWYLRIALERNNAVSAVNREVLESQGMDPAYSQVIAQSIAAMGQRWLQAVNSPQMWWALSWGTARDRAVTSLQKELAEAIADRLVRLRVGLITGGGPAIMGLYDHLWRESISDHGVGEMVKTAVVPLFWTGDNREPLSCHAEREFTAPAQVTLDDRTALFFVVRNTAIILVSASSGIGSREELARALVGLQLRNQIITGFSGIESAKLPRVVLLDEYNTKIREWRFSGLQQDWAMSVYNECVDQSLFGLLHIIRIGDYPRPEDRWHKDLHGLGPQIDSVADVDQAADLVARLAAIPMNGHCG